MRKIAASMVAFVLAACVTDVAHAAEPFAAAAYGFDFLGKPRGVRNIGMGATGTADASGLATGYFNPASVGFVSATTAFGSYEDLYLDQSLSDFLVSTPIPFRSDSTGEWRFGMSLGYSRLSFPATVERTIFLPEGTGHTFDPDEWAYSALAAASWTRHVVSLSVGATGKYVGQRLGDDLNVWALDVGAIAAFPIPLAAGRVTPRLGFAALNLDTGAQYHDTEVSVANGYRGGFAFDLETPPVSVFGKAVPSTRFSFDYDRIDRQADSVTKFGAGFELALVNLVDLRYGVIDDNYRTYGVGVGWDYGRSLFRLDYAHTEPQDGFISYRTDLDRDTFGALVGVRW